METQNSELSSKTLGSVNSAEISPYQGEGRISGFSVTLANFDGPFDLLLQLISRHKMDITEVAIASV
ncbi:MAG: segregation/condensation protein A, partial [Candidatus Nanopelagicaceae bacterium]